MIRKTSPDVLYFADSMPCQRIRGVTFWQRKILSFLHDPPEKPYDYSPEHERKASSYLQTLGLLGEWKQKQADWCAAAADRFIAPRGRSGTSLGGGVQFFHPLAGKKCSLSALDFPSQADGEKIISDSIPAFQSVSDDQSTFWNLWRLWLHYSVTHHSGQNHNAGNLAYLPADTRIPDTSIWNHCSVVSAIEATRADSGDLAPAFLIFQIGPVQEFIAQAQSTRDLWSGSFLLSWLMAHAMKACADELGPDTVIFPSLRGQPLYDWLERTRLEAAKFTTTDGTESDHFWNSLNLAENQRLPLTPGFPNRFLAIVPSDFHVQEKICSAFEKEWTNIAESCLAWLKDKGHPIEGTALELWRAQISNQWRIHWQVLPWSDAEAALSALSQIPSGSGATIHAAKAVAMAFQGDERKEDRDDRCFKNGKLDAGWAWSAHYQLCQYQLDARRQTREFDAWKGENKFVKDAFSGKEEAVVFDKWLDRAGSSREIGPLFRHKHPLGAPNLIKRIWHLAYLAEKRGFDRSEFAFPSVPSIAAEPWRDRVLRVIARGTPPWIDFLAFKHSVERAQTLLEFDASHLPADESKWLNKVDASIFHASYWENLKELDADESALRDSALTALRSLYRRVESKPDKYYAVLALDGDEIGKWLSGEKTPRVREVITDESVEWFEAKMPRESREWLAGHRPLSPGYHLQFSEALANFGLHCARRIVEHHGGRLVYSGGDDVLAILPADEAIACAIGLRKAFQGDPTLEKDYCEDFKIAPQGFVRLENCKPSEPSWNLLVPGPSATVSVGIAIGHIKEPLQDMIQEAQKAEKHAKNSLDRDALSIRLFKRSGEQVHWGAKFGSPAFKLSNYFAQHYRAPVDKPKKIMPISGKFPYRVCSMLSVYEAGDKLTTDLQQIAEKELEWIVKQNTEKSAEGQDFCKDTLRDHFSAYLADLIKTGGTLNDFCSLFAMEAFLARQGDER